MNTSNIVIVPKMSKYELDLHMLRLTHDQLVAWYERTGIDSEKIIRSHEAQKQSLAEFKRLFDPEQFIHREQLTKEVADNADLVIALGGDNHFQYVSHFLDNSELIMGVNLDPARSVGELTYFTTQGFEEVLKRLERDDFEVEEWTRIEAISHGQITVPATSELSFGENIDSNMSRYIIEIRGERDEQKASGLLVATGAGSTGWYNSEGRYLFGEKGNVFPKTERIARFLARAPYGELSRYTMLEGILREGEILTVRSLNDAEGVIKVDAIEKYPFEMGAEAVARISDNSLRVVGAMK